MFNTCNDSNVLIFGPYLTYSHWPGLYSQKSCSYLITASKLHIPNRQQEAYIDLVSYSIAFIAYNFSKLTRNMNICKKK